MAAVLSGSLPRVPETQSDSAIRGVAQAAFDRMSKVIYVAYPGFNDLFRHTRHRVSEEVPTACVRTDGTYAFNPHFFLGLASDGERATLIVHEIMHLALSHFDRLGERDPRLFNVAADHEINLLLEEAGFVPIPGWICDDRFRNMRAEDIYAILQQEMAQEQQQQQQQQQQQGQGQGQDEPGQGQPGQGQPGQGQPGQGKGQGKPKDGTDGPGPGQWGDMDVEGSQAIKQGTQKPEGISPNGAEWAEMAEQALKSVGVQGGAIIDWLRAKITPNLNVGNVIGRLAKQKLGDDDISYYRESSSERALRGYAQRNPVRAPKLAVTMESHRRVLVIQDLSGSRLGEQVKRDAEVIKAIQRILEVPVDVMTHDVDVLSDQKDVVAELLPRTNGGGTNHEAVLAYAEERAKGRTPYDVIVMLTDGYTNWPQGDWVARLRCPVILHSCDELTPDLVPPGVIGIGPLGEQITSSHGRPALPRRR
jgi:predicted metal-dependent peptidase